MYMEKYMLTAFLASSDLNYVSILLKTPTN